MALEKKTGKLVWRGENHRRRFGRVLVVVIANFGEMKQYVTLMANGLVSFAARTARCCGADGTKGDRFGGNTATSRRRSSAASTCSHPPVTAVRC